jgi:TP901 family phage tail tape measure protein
MASDKLIRIILELEDRISKQVKTASSALDSFAATATKTGATMSAALTAPLVGIGIAAAKTAMDFDKSLRNIQSITQQTDESLQVLGQQFLDLSMDMTKTTDSAQNLSEAYYTIIGSGVDAADAMGVLEAATKAASAGLTTTETAAQAMVAVMNAYGLEASEAARISDLMFQTVNRGVGTFEALSGAMGTVVGSASALGVAEEELFAAIATLSKQGQSFETATTNINAALTSLMAPTEAMEKAFNDLGYESGSAMIETLGFAGTMQKLAEYTGGSQEAMAALFGDVRSMRAAFGLTGEAAGMFAEDLAAMGASAGATQAAFDIQMRSFAAAWKNFQNTLGVALIEIGNIVLPFLADLLNNYITPLVKWFISLDDATQGWIIGIAAVIAAIGPLLLILGQIAGAIVAIQGAFAAFAGLGATITAAMAGIIPAIMAIIPVVAPIAVALGLLFLAYQTNFLGIRDIVNSVMSFVSENLQKAGTAFSQLVTLLQHAWTQMNQAATNALGKLGSLLALAWSKMLNDASQAATNLVKAIGGGIMLLGKMAMQWGGDIMKGLIIGVLSKINEFIATIRRMADGAAQAVRNALGIKSPSKVMMDIGQQVVAGFNKGIESFGGVGVNVNGTSVSGSASPVTSGAVASTGGGGMVNYNTFQLAPGTTDQQIREISQKLGKLSERRGAKKSRK